MNKPAIKIILILAAIFCTAVYPVSGQEGQGSWQYYQIDQPDYPLLRKINSVGGVIDLYRPESKRLRVYLKPEMLEQLRLSGIEPYPIPDKTRIYADSLWEATRYTVNPLNGYHTYEEVTAELQLLAAQYPAICDLLSIGQTVEGREMWILKISDNPLIEEAEPEFKYVSTMHGDEIVGQELLINLIHLLLENYGTDARITNLVDNAEIWIMPSMNYDGTFHTQRWNANGVDLNRDFPDREWDAESDTTGREPETINMILFSLRHHFTLSANFHGGALVANYPWDKKLPGDDGAGNYAAAPDDATFIDLALTYASNNLPMFNSPFFQNGITNGADWYEISGGMQDWNYYYLHDKELTIEVSQIKWPAYSTIAQFWLDNREAMLAYMEKIFTGIKGTVRDSLSLRPVAAEIKILETGTSVASDSFLGDYYKVIVPGTYSLQFSAPGYLTKTVYNVGVDSFPATVVEVSLRPLLKYRFSGLISDRESGLPLRQATISLTMNDSVRYKTQTSVDGQFTLTAAPDSYGLLVEKNGYFPFSDSLQLSSDTATTIQLEKIIPAVLKGFVRNSGGDPLPDAMLFCQGFTDTTDITGAFRLEGLMPGGIQIVAASFGYLPVVLDTSIANGDSLTLLLQLTAGGSEFYTSFEADSGGFAGTADWQMGEPLSGPGTAHSGSKLWATQLEGEYSAGPMRSVLVSPPVIVLGLSKPVLRFFHWYATEQNYDGGNVKISTDGGQNWELLYPTSGYPVNGLNGSRGNPMQGEAAFSGNAGFWQEANFDLQPFASHAVLQFRFDFGADSLVQQAGWFIDDVQVIDGNVTGTEKPGKFFKPDGIQLSAFPNPFNPEIVIQLMLPVGRRLTIEIFDVRGAKIKRISESRLPAGTHTLRWDGMDAFGRPAASGTYFLRIKGKQTFLVKKILLIR